MAADRRTFLRSLPILPQSVQSEPFRYKVTAADVFQALSVSACVISNTLKMAAAIDVGHSKGMSPFREHLYARIVF